MIVFSTVVLVGAFLWLMVMIGLVFGKGIGSGAIVIFALLVGFGVLLRLLPVLDRWVVQGAARG